MTPSPHALDICMHCGTRPASINWTGEGGVMDYIHGNYSRWCAFCATEAQLAHAREMAALIPDLETKLETLR